MNLFNSPTTLWGKCYYPQFTERKSEIEKWRSQKCPNWNLDPCSLALDEFLITIVHYHKITFWFLKLQARKYKTGERLREISFRFLSTPTSSYHARLLLLKPPTSTCLLSPVSSEIHSTFSSIEKQDEKIINSRERTTGHKVCFCCLQRMEWKGSYAKHLMSSARQGRRKLSQNARCFSEGDMSETLDKGRNCICLGVILFTGAKLNPHPENGSPLPPTLQSPLLVCSNPWGLTTSLTVNQLSYGYGSGSPDKRQETMWFRILHLEKLKAYPLVVFYKQKHYTKYIKYT